MLNAVTEYYEKYSSHSDPHLQDILQLLNQGVEFLLNFFHKNQGHGRCLNQLLSGLAHPSSAVMIRPVTGGSAEGSAL